MRILSEQNAGQAALSSSPSVPLSICQNLKRNEACGVPEDDKSKVFQLQTVCKSGAAL